MGRMLRALQQIEAKSPPPAADGKDDRRVAADDALDDRDRPPRAVVPQGDADAVSEEPVRDPAAIEATLAHAEIAMELATDVSTVETVFSEIPESGELLGEVSNVILGEVPDIPEAVTAGEVPRRPESLPEPWGLPPFLKSPFLDSQCLESSGEVDDAHGEMADNILANMRPDHPTALMFTSPGDGETRIGLVISLAAALVRRTAGEVLVVDANLRAPSLGAYLGINAPCGLAHVLMGTANWPQVVRKSTVERLSLLPGSQFPTHDGQPSRRSNLEWTDLGRLLKELKEAYSLVLVDAASLAHDEVAPASRYCDGTYLAVRLRQTTRRSVREAVRVVGDCGGRVLGSIVVRD
ncbi:MAG: CpsD/CapB family tyrosine-protein kinase [Thermoguttaceae bacterium]